MDGGMLEVFLIADCHATVLTRDPDQKLFGVRFLWENERDYLSFPQRSIKQPEDTLQGKSTWVQARHYSTIEIPSSEVFSAFLCG